MMSNRSRKCCWMDCSSLSSLAVWQRNQDICLYHTAGFCERRTDQGRVCKWINTVVMDLSAAGWHLYWSLCVCVCVCVCVWLPVLPVTMCCSQAVWVHVSQRSRRDAVSTHGPDHGVGSSLQEQTHQLEVTWTRMTTTISTSSQEW